MRAVVAVIVASALVAGCASPANREAMVPPQLVMQKRHAATVTVVTRGGSDTGLADSSNVSDADLKAALESAITRSGVFRSAVAGKGGDYELTVSITQLSKPVVGFAATVDLETAWVLMKSSSKAIVMRKVVKASHTATGRDAIVGVTRLRLAVEGAVRENIRQGLEAIGFLDL